MNLKKKDKLSLTGVYIIMIVMIAIVLIIFSFLYFNARKTVWCYLENNITDPANPRNECIHLKILSRDVDKIDFNKFYKSNVARVGCTDYEDMPPCKGDEYHFTQFGLYQLSISDVDVSDVDGIICLAYYVTFYDADDPFIEGTRDWYRMKFKEQVNSSYELEEKIINCKEK